MDAHIKNLGLRIERVTLVFLCILCLLSNIFYFDQQHRTGHSPILRPYFFNTWFTDFFFQNIKVGGGKRIKIKITKNFFIF